MWLCRSRSTFSLFALCSVPFSQSAVSGQAGYCDCIDPARGAVQLLAPKQDTTCLDTWGANSEVEFCLLNYFCTTNWYLPSLVLQFVLAAKIILFLCIVSSVNVINSNKHTQDKSNRSEVTPVSGPFRRKEERRLSQLALLLPNERNFVFISLRTSSCHQTLRSLQYSCFITDGAKWTLTFCTDVLNTGNGTHRSLCFNWVVWKKKRLLLLKSPVPNLDCSQWSTS